MNKELLLPEVQEFIRSYPDYRDTAQILFQKSLFAGIGNAELVEQINSRRKCLKKLPSWYGTAQVYYPKGIHIEQTSSETVAKYKANLGLGSTIIDLTGGLGVDSYYFSKKAKEVVYCEKDASLAAIAAHNFSILPGNSIRPHVGNGLDYLKGTKKSFDSIYVDPSRRNANKGKVYHLSDCEPDITAHLDLLFAKTDHVLLKTAPYLDISEGIRSIRFLKQLHILAVNGEVKELLWEMERKHSTVPLVKTINFLASGKECFSYELGAEKQTIVSYSEPQHFLYEPNAAIMKSGGFKSVAAAYRLNKLHVNTHLYTSLEAIDFPGRVFTIEKCMPYSRAEFKRMKIKRANISSRNFGESVASIRKKFTIADGGDRYLFFTRSAKGTKVVLFCSKNRIEKASVNRSK